MDDKKGWVKLYRKLLDSALWKDCNAAQKAVLVTLLLMADHSPSSWVFNGEEYKTEPGQMVTSLPSIAEKAGVSVSQVRRSLMKFEKFNFSTGKPTNKNRLVTIENWALYQGQDEKPTGKPAGNRQATGRQPTANKNIRIQEYKNTNKDILSCKHDGVPATDDTMSAQETFFNDVCGVGETKANDADVSEQANAKDTTKRKQRKAYDGAIYREIVEYLNEKVGTNYKASTKDTRKKITARLNEGFTVEDFKRVIEIKAAEWLTKPGMAMYLRPLTLFGPNFESYLQQENVQPKVYARVAQSEEELEEICQMWE